MKKLIILLAFILVGINVQAKDTDIIARGQIQALSESSVTVRGLAYVLSGTTKYEALDGSSTSLSTFSVGDIVKVKGQRINGTLVAEEMEHEDDIGGGGSDDDGNDDSSDDDDDNSNSNKSSSSKLKSRLSGDQPEGILFRARAKSKFFTRTKKNDSRERFRIWLKTFPAENDLTATATLRRTGQDYAICTLEFNQVQSNSNRQVAEYKVDMKSRTKKGRERVQYKKGGCDVDLTLEGLQEGIPSVERGDEILLQFVDPENYVLQGSF